MKLLDISISKPKSLPQPKAMPRRAPFACINCGISQMQHGANVRSATLLRAKVCGDCFDAEGSERKAAIGAERMARRLLGETPAQRRYVQLVLATPVWRDREAIKAIYAEADRLTKLTGIKHEVDHIYPIQSKYACGLHVHHNMQILEKTHNRSKKNKFPMHDSPALQGI